MLVNRQTVRMRGGAVANHAAPNAKKLVPPRACAPPAQLIRRTSRRRRAVSGGRARAGTSTPRVRCGAPVVPRLGRHGINDSCGGCGRVCVCVCVEGVGCVCVCVWGVCVWGVCVGCVCVWGGRCPSPAPPLSQATHESSPHAHVLLPWRRKRGRRLAAPRRANPCSVALAVKLASVRRRPDGYTPLLRDKKHI